MKREEDEFIRKRKIRQKKIRRRRLKIAFVAFLFLCVAVFCVLALTVLFPIKSFTVTGSEHYTKKEIIAASGLRTGDNIIVASEKQSLKRLRKELPYIEKVTFKRALSGELKIVVTEAEEKAAYQWNNGYYPVSGENHILRKTGELPEGLLIIKAKIQKPTVGEDIVFSSKRGKNTYESLLSYANNNGLNLNELDLSQEVSIAIKTEGRFLVRFGTKNYLEEKFRHLAAMIQKIAPEETGEIDLSMWTPTHTEGSYVKKAIE